MENCGPGDLINMVNAVYLSSIKKEQKILYLYQFNHYRKVQLIKKQPLQLVEERTLLHYHRKIQYFHGVKIRMASLDSHQMNLSHLILLERYSSLKRKLLAGWQQELIIHLLSLLKDMGIFGEAMIQVSQVWVILYQ